MKFCKHCGETKALDEFHRHKLTSEGRNTYCKPCTAARAIAWKKENPTKAAKHKKKWNGANPKKLIAATKKWKVGNMPRVRAAASVWTKAHPAQNNTRNSRHRAEKFQATPAWANEFYISEIYDLAQRRTAALGVEHEVDHIVPLRSKFVCGLHCEHNLQVIPAPINASKGNRHWPDMPEVRM